ncbi:MAG: DUF3892 domain-containing protein [Oscillospiraceae bacterium]|nr:DUF3892 domain-containing protein [Oscillospiraceae bacterium]
MQDLNKINQNLPLNAVEIPPTAPNADTVTALKKESGRVVGYQLSSGEVLAKDEAVSRARQGGIAGVGISNRKGNEYLKSIPDDTEDNNLGNLPAV